MKFTKMQGCGNDYVYMDCTKTDIENEGALAMKVSDRHFGIGSDGLILIRNSEVADFRMSMYNADGSEGKMCGNGIRCVGKYIYDHGLSDKTTLTVETLSGIKTLELNVEDGKVLTVRVDMGKPAILAEHIPAIPIAGKEQIIHEPLTVGDDFYYITCVSMGNPHCITFLPEIKDLDLEKIGPGFENHPMFPERVNTEFVKVISRTEIDMRVWERGSGETFACGTGACASAIACILNGLTEDAMIVHLLGGDLLIEYDKELDTVFMTGPAVEVFEGELFV